MGLDIRAYSALSKIDSPEFVDGDLVHWDSQWKASVPDYISRDFPGRSDGVEIGAVYTYAESLHCSVGSYGGYNAWRDQLACIAGYKSASDAWSSQRRGPFFELINFSDCEGIIGPVIARKLANDFATYRGAVEHAGDDWFLEIYHHFERAFRLAANEGAVRFS